MFKAKFSRRKFLATSVLSALYGVSKAGVSNAAATPLSTRAEIPDVTPWRNWSGALTSNPKQRLAPANESELVDMLVKSTGHIRPVGAGHSFSALVPTDDNLLVLDNMTGLLAHSIDRHTAVLSAGTRLSDAGTMLANVNQSMLNLPDIDRQTLAGAISTSTHGTGIGTGSMSKYVNELRLITADGTLHELNADRDRDLFDAARVSLGALGVITAIGFQNRPAFKLRSKVWLEATASVIESFPERMQAYAHYEFMPFLHADYSMVIAHEETDAEDMAPPVAEDATDLFNLVSKIPVFMRKPAVNFLLGSVKSSESVEASHLALTNIRNDRFNEMEYAIPIDHGLKCLREVLDTVEKQGTDVVFPLEYRVVDSDNTWLSMFSGEQKATISIHRMASEDHRPYFDLIEPIFWKYGGRPHWGKVHNLGYQQLSKLYPRFDDFVEVQKMLDPKGRMLNTHLQHVLGL